MSRKTADPIKATIVTEDRHGNCAYSDDIADMICKRIAAGESLRRICSDDGTPDRNTVLNWARDIPEFAAKYARAREDQAEYGHDVMIEIEQNTLAGKVDAKAANVVMGNMRWRMEKLKPKVFNQKVEVEHSVSTDTADLLRAARERLSTKR